MPTKIE